MQAVRVTLRPDGFTPSTFRWQGALVRVLGVERVETRGLERVYRVRTAAGSYQLGFHASAARWYVRRSPSRFSRALLRWLDSPRYAVPARRRRGALGL